MFIFPLVNGMLLLLMTKVRLNQLLCLIVAMSILEIVCEETDIATKTCEDNHNKLSSKISFMANCKKDGAMDKDSKEDEKHKCYMMRRHCAKKCTTNAYSGECDVQSVFTLNLKVDSEGNYETLDCVCTYHSYKIGCYANYEIPWTTVTEEFSQECAIERTTTPTMHSAIKILLIGGDGSESSMEIYNPYQPENNHEVIVPLRFPRQSHTSFKLNDQAIMTVGGNPGTYKAISLCESYNPTTNKVSECANLTEARFGPASAVLDGVVYVCGGLNHIMIVSSCESYQSGQWQSSPQMLTARKSFAMTSFEGRVYAIGGHNTEETALATVEQYNPNDRTWIIRQEMTTKRYGHTAAVLNGLMYVCGGNWYSVLKSCERYDPSENKWDATIGEMNEGRIYVSLFAAENNLFAMGFGDQVEKYEVNEDRWIKLEKKLIHIRSMHSAVLLS